jgi:solute carrier family 34 (sodium-dependent phosphate cotransporter)
VPAPLRGVLVVGLLYLFLVGVSLLEAGISGLSSDIQAELFSSVAHPLAGLCVGILATVLAQSSSVTTSSIVGLVGAGLLGIDEAVPMIMGANIGTTVTNTLASIGHLRRAQEFRLAFAAATVHDFFNVLAVAVLLPLELTTKVLSSAARSLTEVLIGGRGATFESPMKQAVKLPSGWVEGLWESIGLGGSALGVVLIISGFVAIFAALAYITKNMRSLVAGRVERSLNSFLSRGGGATAMLLGMVITISVQSSSITTSVMIPLAASGVVALRNVYPVTLGANVGTTVTALLASMATNRPEALTVALLHTLFNLAGIALFYPVPLLRDLPIRLARRSANLAAEHHSAVIGYIVVIFILIPALGVIVLR